MIVDFNALRQNFITIQQIDDLELSNRAELIESHRVAYTQQRISSNVRELLLEWALGGRLDEIELAKQKIGVARVEMEEALVKLNRATYLGTGRDGFDELEQQEIEKLNTMMSRVPEFFSSLDRVLALQEEGKFEEAEEVFEDVLEPSSRYIQERIAEIAELAKEEIEWAIRQLNIRVRRTIRLGIYLSVLSFIFAIGLGLLISRSISKPLMKLVRSADEIGRGNLDTFVDLNTKGELQILAGSFNQMAYDLKQKVDAIEQVNEALLESNETKDKFFSIIAHDLKNPFNAILGYSYILSESYGEFGDEERKEMIEEIDRSSRITYELLENLLNWARSQSNKIEIKPVMLDVSDIAEKSIESHHATAKGKRINVLNEVPKGLMLEVDRETFSVILNNVLSNSIKFTPEGGEVIISAEKRAGEVVVSIRDSGVGMSEEAISRLFLREGSISTLGTGQENGTGLGLVLVKDFVERNRGRLEVKSQQGEGSEFFLFFPGKHWP